MSPFYKLIPHRLGSPETCPRSIRARTAGTLLLGLASTSAHSEESLFEAYLRSLSQGEKSVLPDYSHAGYHRSEKPIPETSRTSHRFFDVTDFGAIPDDGKSDRDATVNALVAAHQYNGPAVVFFPEGNFRLFEDSDFGKPPLEIRRSGIVIKGSGTGTTQLEFTETHLPTRPLITMRSSSGEEDYWRGDQDLRTSVTRQHDSFSVDVSDASQLEPGMRINLTAEMDPRSDEAKRFFCPHDVPKGILDRAKRNGGKLNRMMEIHEIAKIDGTRVTFTAPIHLELKAHTNIRVYRLDEVIEECGIEDLSLRGGWRGQFKHHNGSRYGEDFLMIGMDRVFNSWVRRVRISEFSFAIRTTMCGFNTFSNILLEGNAGHNSITSMGSYGNLFAYIREQTDTHHGLGVSRSGTNTVFYRCVQYKSMEAHGAFPRATLYDLNEGGFEPRGGGATFFPMHDKGLTFWNWKVTTPGTFDFWPEGKPYGYFLNPVIAGLHGEEFAIPDIEKDILVFETPGRKTSPESLFDAQLENRLGELPTWLADASEEFESVSRHSRVEIISPTNHSSPSSSLVRMALPDGLDREQLRKLELHASNSNLYDGFELVGEVDLETLETDFKAEKPGIWILRAKLTNRRGEVSHSRPITIFIGDPSKLSKVPVSESAMIPAKDKAELYSEFVNKGGGEAPRLKGSESLASRNKNQPAHEIEDSYREELHSFYTHFGRTRFRKSLDDQRASSLFDGETQLPGTNLSSYQDTLVQARFPSPRKVCRLDIHCLGKVPKKSVRFEVQGAVNPEAWLSVVNDDRLWEPSIARLGGTLRKEPLPGSGHTTTLYFPERQLSSVRMLFTSFPKGVAELEFYGP